LVNSFDCIWTDGAAGLRRSEARFSSELALRDLIVRLARSSGQPFDEAHPFVSVMLPTGVRLHAVLPPISRAGVIASFRIPSRSFLTFDELIAVETIDLRAAAVIRELIERKKTFLICGSTGSGKTTLLRSLLAELDGNERVVIIEDTPELRMDKPNIVELGSRLPNSDHIGAIDLTDLVHESLRMRPDRIVVGEVRGAEVLDLLRAMNTGHRGSCGTVHANSAVDVIPRLLALCQLGGVSHNAALSLIGSAIDVVIEIGKDSKQQRRVLAVVELHTSQSEKIEFVDTYRFASCA
jgi:pilus assembly protein CpaF